MNKYAILDSEGNVTNVVAAENAEDINLGEGLTAQALTSQTITLGDGSTQDVLQSYTIGQPLT